MTDNIKKATKYAKDVVTGKIPACRFIVKTCQQYLDDLERQQAVEFPYYFAEDKAEKACKFIQYLPHTKGEWALKRQNITLEPWQLFIVANAFGWLRKSNNLRRYREIYVEVPRKNGKSAISAGVGLYMFCMDNEFGAEVYSGATTEKQAWEVFRPARLMCKKTDLLCSTFGIEVNASNLNRPSDGSRFEPLIGSPGDGASPSCAIVDEYHEHKNDELYTTMLTGMGARKQPLMFIITTAGYQQRMEDGINTLLRKYSVTYKIENKESAQFRNFMKEHSGVRAFYFKDIALGGELVKVVCTKFPRQVGKTHTIFTCEFEEVV